MKSTRLVLTAAAVGAVIWFALAKSFGALEPRDDLTGFGSLLAALFFAALVLERSLDVFFSLTFGASADQLDTQVKAAQEQVEQAKAKGAAGAAELADAQKGLDDLRRERMDHRGKTMRMAMPAAAVLGTILAAVGLRVLHSLVTKESVAALEPLQRQWLVGIDIVVTGFLLGGGSDPIHRIMTVLRTWTETQRTKTP